MSDDQERFEDRPNRGPQIDMLDDEEMTRLLCSVIEDQSVSFPRHDRLRSRMLEEFDRRERLDVSSTTTADTDPSIEFVEIEESGTGMNARPGDHRSIKSWRWLAAAAVLVIGGLGLGLIVADQRTDSTEIDAASSRSSLLAEGSEPPSPIEAGTHRTEAVAGGIAFDLPEGFEVLAERQGFVELGLVNDSSEPRARVIILEPSADTAAMRSLVSDLEAGGFLTAVESLYLADSGPLPEWELRTTNDASTAFDCTSTGACVPFGDVSLWSGGNNLFTEIEGPDGQRIWWIEQSGFHLDPIHLAAHPVLISLRFD